MCQTSHLVRGVWETCRDVHERERKDARNLPSNKWMVSLDGCWVHVAIATYDRTYVDFLTGSQPSTKDAFMEMDEYGPFDLRDEVSLEHVGALMLGVPSS